MCPQMACLRGWIVTLVAFVRLLSTVCFQMSPQMVCPRVCKITLDAFICSSSVVCFQMFPQTVLPGGCVITLVRVQLPEQVLSKSWHRDIALWVKQCKLRRSKVLNSKPCYAFNLEPKTFNPFLKMQNHQNFVPNICFHQISKIFVDFFSNKLGDAIAISNLKLWMTHWPTDSPTDRG